MIVAITGTPGTGKSAVCAILERRGYAIVDLEHEARVGGFITGRDEGRQTDEVDVEGLRRHLRIPAKIAFLKGHYSHLMDANLVIVLRCRPNVLRERLQTRGWPEAKILENVEAEAIDVILQEAVGRLPFVYEVDTTEATPDETGATILSIMQGKTQGHEPGSVDWTSEVLSWY
ncbi:MAG: dephospho-CoA kinase [Methanobacteriota archaeon]|nr:MAG: dephospho-CoA kinase [Euryarchaeota archaeon]TLZ66818.1 MAG: dephospho-CoA kinase [Euryarchaeota archaeon]